MGPLCSRLLRHLRDFHGEDLEWLVEGVANVDRHWLSEDRLSVADLDLHLGVIEDLAGDAHPVEVQAAS